MLRKAIFILSCFFAVSILCQQCAAADTSQPVKSLRCNEFTFDATGSYDPDNDNISFLWDFGDGSTSTEPVVTHVYERPGEYEVSLSITDSSDKGCCSSIATQKVKVNIPPYADFDAPDTVCTDKEIVMDAKKSRCNAACDLDYSWNFGDGTRAYGKKVVRKVYNRGGDYKISLTVTDKNENFCNSHSAEKIIHVNAPPKAEAGPEFVLKCVSDPNDMVVSFDASSSMDENNDPLNYEWDFGDGTKDYGLKVSHRYSEVGNYDVKLVVRDDSGMDCSVGIDFQTVRLNKAPKADAGDDVVGCVGERILFDGSNSFIYKKGTVSAKWSFDDGTSAEGLKVSHAYNNPGKYQAVLSLENNLNSTCPVSRDTRMVTINSSPTVDIKNVNTICLGERIQFDASEAVDPDGDPLQFYWSFGDGNISQDGPKISHQYQQGGNYRVNVIVDDGRHTKCSTATAYVDIKVNTPPIADAGPDMSVCLGSPVRFDATASVDPDGDILRYIWNFGDGSSAEGAVVTHIYAKSGLYNVSLTVDDNASTKCSRSTDELTVKVNAKPVPVINIR